MNGLCFFWKSSRKHPGDQLPAVWQTVFDPIPGHKRPAERLCFGRAFRRFFPPQAAARDAKPHLPGELHRTAPLPDDPPVRDVAQKLSETLAMLEEAGDGLMFDGEPLDEETRQLLRASLENQLEMTKRLAKQKFTPKKYRKE